MGKAMSVAGLIVGGLIVAMFASDILLRIPFGGPSRSGTSTFLPEVGLALCGAMLAYLGWNAFRQVK
jgi:hypothetical protein